MKHVGLCAIWLVNVCIAIGQTTFPSNGPRNTQQELVALTQATIWIDYQTVIENATLLIKEGRIIESGINIKIPAEARQINCKGRYIYPGFIDLYSNYGIQQPMEAKKNEQDTKGFISAKKGAYHWNESIRAEFNASHHFAIDEKKAEQVREFGFTSVLASLHDGICRGAAALVCTGKGAEQEQILLPEAATTFSFNKGSSKQHYPSSLMGSIALLRQTNYDARWYARQSTEINLTLDAYNRFQKLPALFAADGKLNILRADKLGDEFGVQYIIKGAGDEYQRIAEIKATNAPLVIPVNFPKAYEVENPFDAEFVSTTDLMHWEMAPANIKVISEQQIPFSITASGCADANQFLTNLRKAIKYGANEMAVLKALTFTPASLLKQPLLGNLNKGSWANFIVCDKPLFAEDALILDSWVKGESYTVNKAKALFLSGKYEMTTDGEKKYFIKATNKNGKSNIIVLEANDTAKSEFQFEKGVLNMRISLAGRTDSVINIVAYTQHTDSNSYPPIALLLKGLAHTNEKSFSISINRTDTIAEKPKIKDSAQVPNYKKEVVYPFTDYGFSKLPQPQNYVLKNATIWTNEAEGILQQADVWIENGKIRAVGKNIKANNATEIDATGKHITSGIIDEHSHIAISNGVNEGTQSSSSEVRVGDVINSEDINIYRQLAGGVTAAQLLHGSANPIGGQSALIKLRWGFAPEQMGIKNADGFIKFALGENVKQSNWGDRNVHRYPQTRMGVEQVFYDAFMQAKEYEIKRKQNSNTRRDLELDAIVEILNRKRFITCHSYVQSEINMLMHVADSMGFKVNTFTHILEGYKVADKMKKHGVNASTFADWWAYKFEVMEAIPYNAAIMHRMGINTAINSDDAEMGRRLNQEAAKTIKYGNISEEEAWKMVTLNPAKMLHLDKQMGSMKIGKDADIVVWSQNPLSIYAQVEMSFVDGMLLFSREQSEQMVQVIKLERERIIRKMIVAKQQGEATEKKQSKPQPQYHCDDEEQ
jgi:imidazolonepropionase-like amidohydrolase